MENLLICRCRISSIALLVLPGETFQEVINDVTAVRVAKQSGLEKQILETGETVNGLNLAV